MNYPLWDLFLTMLELFVWIVLIVLVIWVILNILRRHDLNAWAKVGWLILVIVLPFIGVFTYLIVRGAHLAGEQVATANAPQDERFRRYERFEAQGKDSTDELAKLADLRDRGVITDAEFQKRKTQLLGLRNARRAGRRGHQLREAAAPMRCCSRLAHSVVLEPQPSDASMFVKDSREDSSTG